MNRLTRWNNKTEQPELVYWDKEEWKEFMETFDVLVKMNLINAFEKLAYYEDLEEQNLLLKLPCNTNEWVWIAHEKRKCAYKVLYTCKSDILADMEEGFVFGYTKAEAEKALAEMKGE